MPHMGHADIYTVRVHWASLTAGPVRNAEIMENPPPIGHES